MKAVVTKPGAIGNLVPAACSYDGAPEEQPTLWWEKISEA